VALLVPEFLDWIELKNNGGTAADIGGWHLTDELDEPEKWTFPAGTSIPAGGYLVWLAAEGTLSHHRPEDCSTQISRWD
jgi:hypothetical protein